MIKSFKSYISLNAFKLPDMQHLQINSEFIKSRLIVLILFTVMILSFRTDKPGETVQTQIRLLEEQSDHGLHCLPFRLHRLVSLHYNRATKFKF